MSTRYDATNARLLVHTFKEGLLSAVAHDLELEAQRFSVEVEGETQVSARVEAESLRVRWAMKDGAPAPAVLAASDKAKIEDNLAREVLHPKKHPLIMFRSSAVEPAPEGYRVRGELELAGRSRAVELLVRREGDVLSARYRLHQPDWGIKPFTAMLGSLRVQADVEILFRTPRA